MSIGYEQLHVIRTYFRLPPKEGGMEQHVAELTAAQRRLGVNVTLAYNSGSPGGEAVHLWSGRDLLGVRPAALRDLLFYGSAIFHANEFRRTGFRIIHSHGDWSGFVGARALARAVGANAIAASLHESMRRRPNLYRWALKRCNPIFTTGLREAKALESAIERPVIHLPSAPAELFFSTPSTLAPPVDVITVGSLIRRKNVELLLQCAARRPDIRFAVYGDGPERRRLEAIMIRERLANVELRGSASPAEVHAGLSAARLFVSTATAEGSPTAALEAMACGLPVVLTPSNDYSRIVLQRINGVVTSGWQVEELLAAFDEFLTRPSRAIEARETSRTIADGHRWEKKAQCVTEAMLAAVTDGMVSK